MWGEWKQLFGFPRFLLLEHTLIRFSWLFSLHRKPIYVVSLLQNHSMRFQVSSAVKLCTFCPYNPYSCTLSHVRKSVSCRLHIALLSWIWWLFCACSFRQWPICTGKASCIEQKSEFLRSAKSCKRRTCARKDFQWLLECQEGKHIQCTSTFHIELHIAQPEWNYTSTLFNV